MMEKEKRNIKAYWIFILLFLIRLIYITNPPLDYSSWRQVDTDSIARNFVEYKFNIFYPQLNYDGPMPNYAQLEFQVTTFIIALLYKVFGFNYVIGRIVPICLFIGSCFYLYKIVNKKSGLDAAIWSVFIYGLLPINVIYSRNIMPESALMFFTIGAIYYFIMWIENDKVKYYALSAIFTTMSILTKPPSAIIGIPMIYLCIKKYGLKMFKKAKLYLFSIIVSGFPLLYFMWLHKVAEIKFVSGIGSNIIFPNFYSSIKQKETIKYLVQQFSFKVFTIPGIILFILGLMNYKKKEDYFYYFWLFGALLHVIFINAVIHLDYYLMIVTPVISIFAAHGILRLYRYGNFRNFVYLCMVFIALNNIIFLKGIYKVNNFYITYGNYIEEFTEKDDIIIIDIGSPELLYTSNRKGFRLFDEYLTIDNIKKAIDEGADYFVPVNKNIPEDVQVFLDNSFSKVFINEGNYIYKLKP